tara:strand:+ start:2417 stop:3256 length:840 start_codon:yes stop_codon:yes gene_type:complete
MNNLDKPVTAEDLKTGPVKASNVMADDFGIEIPAEIVPLPSRGIIYSEESNLFGLESLEIRPMTAREEDILTSRALIKSGKVISKLIQSCLINKNIDPDDLISGDRNALMVALRITGYGSDYSSEITCPNCGHVNKKEFDLSSLKIRRLEVDPVELGENCFEVVLPVTKKSVKVRFLTGHDERDMLIQNERKKKQGFTTETLVTDRLVRSIISVDNISDRNKIGFFVKNMPVRDSLALRKFLDKNEPGIEMKDYLSCISCHEESEVSIPLGPTFFWPDS